MALTKSEIVEQLQVDFKIPVRRLKTLVDQMFDTIAVSLESGETVKISGFGNFRILHKQARMGRNPKTGKEAFIAARSVVVFRPGDKLRDTIDASML